MGARTKYRAAYAADVLDYFSSFLGYWTRELERLEIKFQTDMMQERAARYAKMQEDAAAGKPITADMLDACDGESVLRAAKLRALERLEKEMGATRRMQGLPSLEKWAKRIGVVPSTVQRWRDQYPSFDEACRDALSIQEDILRDGGLSGIYDGRTVSLLLKMAAVRAEEDKNGEAAGERLEDFFEQGD